MRIYYIKSFYIYIVPYTSIDLCKIKKIDEVDLNQATLENITFLQDIANHHIESGLQYKILI